MASDELAYATIRDIGARLRRRALSPVELTRALLERIERLDPRLNAFVTVTAERALADAKAAEAALGRADISSPLLGIPVGYKDIYATRGLLARGGSALLADWIPTEDATCVTRLQGGGAVMLGKLITHESAFGIQFPGHRFAAAKNPWALAHMPGGSSSGSGAALAAGLAVGALGSDTGGSIRGPASFCGITGLKPTYGRCSRARGLALSWTVADTGPMARPAEGSACLLPGLREHPERFGEILRERMLAGALIPASEYVQAQRLRTQLRADMNAVLRRVDVLATPTSPKTAPTFTTVYDPEYGFPRGNTGPFNMTGLPALALPCGFTAAGLPLSIQITGRPFDEATILRVGHTYEQATSWRTRHPNL